MSEEIFGGGHMSVAAAKELLGIGASSTKVYRALLTQTSTDAPVATVLENTLGGTVTWSYSSAGTYLGSGVGLFSSSTFVSYQKLIVSSDIASTFIQNINALEVTRVSDDQIKLEVGKYGDSLYDDVLSNTLIEIYA